VANDLDPEKLAAAKLTGTEKGEREKYAFLKLWRSALKIRSNSEIRFCNC
jgi:hypothetical protein